MVGIAALGAALLRFPGLLYPIGSDESGYTLVARHWNPMPDSVYGSYFVDRPPSLIALVKLSDLVGGPGFVRVLGMVACAVVVVLAAATARAALRYAGVTDERLVVRTGAWTAVLTAAFVASGLIDPVKVAGELLGIPWVLASFWAALLALSRPRVDATAVALAAAAGFAATTALTMKQNLVGGLVFGAVLLVGARLSGRITTATLMRLAAAAAAGAAVPVLATVGWALVAGVRLETLWYTIYGFRSDAFATILEGSAEGPAARGLVLIGSFILTGMGFVVAGVVWHRTRIAALDLTLLLASVAVVAVDLVGVWLGGSYWRSYLFVLIPGLVLCTALLLAVRIHVARRARVLIVLAAVTSVISSVAWGSSYYIDLAPTAEKTSGEAIARAAEPGDTILVYGGGPDVVLASGLDAPYRHLWSLPMRTLDPDLERLRRLLEGPDAPTWVVMRAPGWAWDHLAAPIRPVLEERYAVHGMVCEGRYVWLRDDVSRPPLEADCE